MIVGDPLAHGVLGDVRRGTAVECVAVSRLGSARGAQQGYRCNKDELAPPDQCARSRFNASTST